MAPGTDTRERILDSARSLIYACSYADVGVAEICSKAGVRKGSFYHYFPSKRDLTVAVLDSTFADFKHDLLDRAFAADVGPRAHLRRLIDLGTRFQAGLHAGCRYCIDLNETFLDGMGADLDDVRAARDDLLKAPLEDNRERLLLDLAVQSVDQPDSDKRALIDKARAAGWGDREIFDAVPRAASNRAFNRVLKTFNVEIQNAFA